MNRLIQQKATLFDLTHNLRDEVLTALNNSDLEYSLGGSTLTLRRLLLEQGEFQAAYTRSFQTFKLHFDLAAPTDLHTIEAIRAWFAQLDREMISALEALSNADLERPNDRGAFQIPTGVTFYTYRESVFIFAAKASIYLRALGRELPEQVRSWIA